jgi:hypothetical protein
VRRGCSWTTRAIWWPVASKVTAGQSLHVFLLFGSTQVVLTKRMRGSARVVMSDRMSSEKVGYEQLTDAKLRIVTQDLACNHTMARKPHQFYQHQCTYRTPDKTLVYFLIGSACSSEVLN